MKVFIVCMEIVVQLLVTASAPTHNYLKYHLTLSLIEVDLCLSLSQPLFFNYFVEQLAALEA